MGKKVHKLEIDEPKDGLLIGIVSNENDYRLSWQINQYLQISLVRLENLSLKQKDKEHQFVQYAYNDEDRFLQFSFLKNKSPENTYFISEQKSCDYFLYVQGSVYEEEYSKIIRKIKEIPDVSFVIKIDAGKLKSRKNLAHL